jgi:hypothetical protein
MLALLLLTLLRPAPAPAQMKTGAEMKNFDVVLGVKSGERSYPFTVRYTKSTIPGNVLFPGEQGTLSFVLQNHQDRPIRLRGAVDVIPYGTRGIPGDIWLPEVVRLGKTIVVPLAVDIPAKAATSVTITPPIPEAKGAYALVVDLGPHGRSSSRRSCARSGPTRQGCSTRSSRSTTCRTRCCGGSASSRSAKASSGGCPATRRRSAAGTISIGRCGNYKRATSR